MSHNDNDQFRLSTENQYITVRIGGSIFGLPISAVHEVFVPENVTRVPLAAREIQGVLNLRGRIVTMIDLRQVLGFPPADAQGATVVGIEYKTEFYGLIIDEVGEVLNLDVAEREACPPNVEPTWAAMVSGVHRVDGELMLILDVEQALSRVTASLAA